MPAKTTRETVSRQWELMKLLPTTGAGITAKELAAQLGDAGFKVSKRQVERDLQDLEMCFPIDCNAAGTPYGWRWAKNASIDLPGMSVAEALSTKLIEEILTPLLPISVQSTFLPRFKQARKKLAALSSKNSHARWADKVRAVPAYQNLIPPNVNEDVLNEVHEALLSERQLEIRYLSMGSEDNKNMILHPLGLISRGSVQYLVATAFNFDDQRLYALHRMSSAKALEEEITRPDLFSLDEYIDRGTTQFLSADSKPIRLKSTVAPWLARILSETPLSDDQTIATKGNHTVVTATVVDTWQLRWWILSQGSGIRIESPKSLAKDIGKELKAAAEAYDL